MSLSLVGVSPSLLVGGELFTDLVNLKKLVAGTGAADTNSTFRENNGTSGFVVPANFKLVVKAIRCQAKLAAVSTNVLCYSDNDVGMGTTTAFTNQVTCGGDADCAFKLPATIGQVIEFGGLNFEVPAGKYLGFSDSDASGAALIQAFGYLVAV